MDENTSLLVVIGVISLGFFYYISTSYDDDEFDPDNSDAINVKVNEDGSMTT